MDRTQGKTLDELLAGAKRLSVKFSKSKSATDLVMTESSEDSLVSTEKEKEKESIGLLDVPVSGTRSLRVRASKKVTKASELFTSSSSLSPLSEDQNLSELLGSFNPRNVGVKELKVKKGSESLLNLVRLSRQHHTSLGQAAQQQSAETAELSIGNRCRNASLFDSVAWTVFVEELNANVESIENVVFGPLPPNSDTVTVREAPFCQTRESSLAFLESMDFQIRIVVNFRGGGVPCVFHHDLSVPGSWGHFEVDTKFGTFRRISPLITESQIEDPKALLEQKIREAMVAESVKSAEEVVRMAGKIGKGVLLEPLKKGRNITALVNQLRPRVRSFLVRGAHARGVAKEDVSLPGDEDAFVADTISLAVDFASFAPDAISGPQFVEAMIVVLTATLHPSKSLFFAAKVVGDSLQSWPKAIRKESMKTFTVKAENFRVKMEQIVKQPPKIFDEEDLCIRVEAEFARRQQGLERRRSLFSSKSKGFYGEKMVVVGDHHPNDEANVAVTGESSVSGPIVDDGDEEDNESGDNNSPLLIARTPQHSSVQTILDSELLDASPTAFEMPGNPLMRFSGNSHVFVLFFFLLTLHSPLDYFRRAIFFVT